MLVPLAKPATPIAQIAVLHDGNRIGTHVQLDRQRPDGDALSYTILYSADDGNTWDTLAVGTGETSLTLPRSDLKAAGSARLQVIASDGVHATSATSSPFSVADNAPQVVIDGPAGGAVFSGLQDVAMAAAAFDPDDGALTGAALSWSSDLDGALGTSEELNVNASTLTEGTHVVTTTASDSAGASSTDSVTIHVFRVAPPPPPPVIDVEVQVKPGSDPTVVQTTGKGVVPVAIVTTDDFDAATVDPATVCFGDANDPTAGDCTEAHGQGHLEDVDGDGDVDLVMHFETQETGIEPGGDRACLTGHTYDGDDLAGCDEIVAR